MISKASKRLWAEDLGLTGLLVVLLVETFVIYPFINSDFGGFAVHLVFIGVLITGVMAVSQTPHWARIVAIIAALGLGSHFWGYAYPSSRALFMSLGFRNFSVRNSNSCNFNTCLQERTYYVPANCRFSRRLHADGHFIRLSLSHSQHNQPGSLQHRFPKV